VAVSIITIVFTQYKIASLISLFVVEIFVVVIWLYYARQKNRTLYPYPYECLLRETRYVFESENKMSYEMTEVIKITHPNLTNREIKLFWSGRGLVTLETPLLTHKPQFNIDGKTGEINFAYPTIPDRKFGDTAIVYFILTLEDSTELNIPELYTRITSPTRMLVMEVVLKYKESAKAAVLGNKPLEGDPYAFLGYQKLADLPFDIKTKSFRSIIPNPILHHNYQIKWEK